MLVEKDYCHCGRSDMRRRMRGGYRMSDGIVRNDYNEGYRHGYKHGWEDHDDEMEMRRGRDSMGRFI